LNVKVAENQVNTAIEKYTVKPTNVRKHFPEKNSRPEVLKLFETRPLLTIPTKFAPHPNTKSTNIER